MAVLKGIGYLLAGAAVLAAFIFGGVVIAFVGLVLGLLFDLVVGAIFTAGALKVYFAERSD